MNRISEAYPDYVGTTQGFDNFHNEVINMPRDSFSEQGYDKVKDVAGYLLLIKEIIGTRTLTYKETMNLISEELVKGNFPQTRNLDLENRYFTFDNIHQHYKKMGRMFRHLMLLASFFGFVVNEGKKAKSYNFEKCVEYALSDKKTFIPVARNNLINVNAKTNECIRSLKSINIRPTTDYRPTYAIMRYINEINRPATKFEISVLLGRIDKIDIEEQIIERALDIGSILPTQANDQQSYFFEAMKWKNGSRFYKYKNSQQPYFKFNTYLLYMVAFGILNFDDINETYTLTEYSKNLLKDDISMYIADLEALLDVVDDYDNTDGKLSEIILVQRNPDFIDFISEDNNFIYKMNMRSINKTQYDDKGKRKRNILISELAKILAGYKCEYENNYVFKKADGRYYTEAHHIIHFNEEDGPDITNNLVSLGPEPHTAIHQGSKEVAEDVYLQLLKNNVLHYKRFEEMVTLYDVINEHQIDLLKKKKILTSKEHENLVNTYRKKHEIVI